MANDDVDGLLENWSPCRLGDNIHFVVGNIIDDRKGRFLDGTLMTSSMLSMLGENLADGMIVETLNSRYRLGSRATEVSLGVLFYVASLGGHVVGPDGRLIEQLPQAVLTSEERTPSAISTPQLSATERTIH